MILTYIRMVHAARRSWWRCKPAELKGHSQIFSKKYCKLLQLVVRQTHCTFGVHCLQVNSVYTVVVQSGSSCRRHSCSLQCKLKGQATSAEHTARNHYLLGLVPHCHVVVEQQSTVSWRCLWLQACPAACIFHLLLGTFNATSQPGVWLEVLH